MVSLGKRTCALLLLVGAAGGTSSAAAGELIDGEARFQVITPTLIRAEYAADRRFEDRPTQTLGTRRQGTVDFTTSADGGVRTISTGKLTLRYRQGSGPFSPENLEIEFVRDGRTVTARPDWATGASTGNLGGWRRGLDLVSRRTQLHDGVLSREGWYLLDDSRTALSTSETPFFAPRPKRSGAYQDGYLFGYGLDYPQALADLRALTGSTPMLPRKAFGVWFSRYWGYTEAELRQLVARFRTEQVPLDLFSMDTDFKEPANRDTAPLGSVFAGGLPEQPFSWNRWSFNHSAYKDPKAFVDWAHSEGIVLSLNIHPSIGSRDPKAETTNNKAGGLNLSFGLCQVLMVDFGQLCGVFDWTKPRHISAYFDLHKEFEDTGADFMWLDWCCDESRADAPGLTPDTHINRLYAERSEARGSRWPSFSRIGGSYQAGFAGRVGNGAFAEHRYSIHFTGDTCATWDSLAFNAEYTAASGNIGLPYVSHDIGSFHGPVPGECGPSPFGLFGKRLPDDMYARWVQLGTYQPLDRLHSNHGYRLPWEYGGRAGAAAAEALRMRHALVPYMYTLARQSHDTGLPMARPLYLQWPAIEDAYRNASQYTLGPDLLVAPVTVPGDPAQVSVWIPPGSWTSLATGERHTGPRTISLSVPLDQMPVFLRDGAILPTQEQAKHSSVGPNGRLTLDVFPGANGRFELYEDDGNSLGYRDGAFARTAIDQQAGRVTIGAVAGNYAGRPDRRSWTLRVRRTAPVRRVTVGGEVLPAGTSADERGWRYDAATRILTVRTGTVSATSATAIRFR